MEQEANIMLTVLLCHITNSDYIVLGFSIFLCSTGHALIFFFSLGIKDLNRVISKKFHILFTLGIYGFCLFFSLSIMILINIVPLLFEYLTGSPFIFQIAQQLTLVWQKKDKCTLASKVIDVFWIRNANHVCVAL